MADCVKRAGDYTTAIGYFTRAIDRDPDNAGTLIGCLDYKTSRAVYGGCV
jgi:hypothetical protein